MSLFFSFLWFFNLFNAKFMLLSTKAGWLSYGKKIFSMGISHKLIINLGNGE
jgi:hypothetical protein